jgi:hypothetical protein
VVVASVVVGAAVVWAERGPQKQWWCIWLHSPSEFSKQHAGCFLMP